MYCDVRKFNEPCRRLVCAILNAAYDRVERDANSKNAARRLRAVHEWLWFASEDTEWVFSFENICGYLRLEPDPIRKQLAAIVFRDRGQN